MTHHSAIWFETWPNRATVSVSGSFDMDEDSSVCLSQCRGCNHDGQLGKKSKSTRANLNVKEKLGLHSRDLLRHLCRVDVGQLLADLYQLSEYVFR